MHVQLFSAVGFQQLRIRHNLLVGVNIAHLILRVRDLVFQIGNFLVQIPVCLQVMIGQEEEIGREKQERHRKEHGEELETTAGFRGWFHNLSGIVDSTGLTDDRDLDLTRIGHLVLNLLGEVE